MAMLGALIAADRSHREIFEVFGVPEPTAWLPLDAGDLYPDARPCLLAVQALGLRVGIAANQPDRAAEIARTLDVELDFVATSAAWGVEKPSPAFFARIASELGCRRQPSPTSATGWTTTSAPAAAAGMCRGLPAARPVGLDPVPRGQSAGRDLHDRGPGRSCRICCARVDPAPRAERSEWGRPTCSDRVGSSGDGRALHGGTRVSGGGVVSKRV